MSNLTATQKFEKWNDNCSKVLRPAIREYKLAMKKMFIDNPGLNEVKFTYGCMKFVIKREDIMKYE